MAGKGIFNGLLAGTAAAAGDDSLLQENRARNREADERKQAWSDERRKASIAEYMGTSNNLHKSLALLTNPDTMQPMPGKEGQVTQLRQQLGQVDEYIRKLYNPNFNSDTGMVAEDPLHKLTDKLHLTHAPKENRTVAQQMGDLKDIQARYADAGGFIDERTKDTEQERGIDRVRGLLKKYGSSDQMIQEITESMLGGAKVPSAQKPAWKLYKLKDGGTQWFDVNDKESIPPDATAVGTAGMTPKPRHAWGKDAKGTYSVLLDPQTNQPIEGSKNYGEQPPSSMTGRITTGFYHFIDDQGNVHQVQETHTSTPAGGGSGASAAPAGRSGAPGGASPKSDKSPSGASGKPGDRILGHKETTVQAKAHKDYIDAFALAKKADDVATKPDDAYSQKRLAVAMEKVSAGRFTQSALDYIKKIGWGATIEEWANSTTTGALPKELVRQMVDGAHQERDSKKRAWDESLNGGSSNAPAGNRNPYR